MFEYEIVFVVHGRGSEHSIDPVRLAFEGHGVRREIVGILGPAGFDAQDQLLELFMQICRYEIAHNNVLDFYRRRLNRPRIRRFSRRLQKSLGSKMMAMVSTPAPRTRSSWLFSQSFGQYEDSARKSS